MAVWIDPTKTWDYVLDSERGTPSPTVWKLRPLTVSQHAELQDLPSLDQKAGTFCAHTGETHLRALKYGLAGVANLGGWCGGTIDDAFLSGLGVAIRTELALAILHRSGLTEADRKNSSSPQGSQPDSLSRTAAPAEV